MNDKLNNCNVEFKLRSCQKDDYDFCYNLFKLNMAHYAEKHWGGWDSNFFIKNYNPDNSIIIEVDDVPIGFYEIETKGKIGIIHDIQIAKEYTGKGIGTRIIRLIEDEFRQNNVKIVRLKVFVDNPAKRLYERLGYKEAGKSNSVGTVIMEKEFC